MSTLSKKYTLTLPTVIYDELSMEADKQGRSIKEIVRQCLKFGLIAMKIDQDQNAELIIREKVQINSSEEPPKFEIRETKVHFI